MRHISNSEIISLLREVGFRGDIGDGRNGLYLGGISIHFRFDGFYIKNSRYSSMLDLLNHEVYCYGAINDRMSLLDLYGLRYDLGMRG